jgi:ATP-dependent RNA helicase RhlE
LLEHTDTDSVLVFTRTKHRAKRLGQQLHRAGYKATSLQGNLSQNQRQSALDGFRSGKYQIMVATDIAARGIDVSSISHVVNYDIPDTAEAYTHRIGRTGRAAKTGDAFTLITSEDTDMVKTIERMMGSKIERRSLDGFDYNAKAPAPDAQTTSRPAPAHRPSQPRRPAYSPRANNNAPRNGNHSHNQKRETPKQPQGMPSRNDSPHPYVSRLASDLPSQQAGYAKRKPRPASANNNNRRRRYAKR